MKALSITAIIVIALLSVYQVTHENVVISMFGMKQVTQMLLIKGKKDSVVPVGIVCIIPRSSTL